MKRDMDLIRLILLAIEAHPKPSMWNVPLKIPEHEEPEVCYHVKLLEEAGLVEAHINMRGGGVLECNVNSLTWAGHEFLEACRDNSRWEKVNRLVKEKTGSLSFEVLKSVLIQAMLSSMSG
jgi:hypothetical protein